MTGREPTLTTSARDYVLDLINHSVNGVNLVVSKGKVFATIVRSSSACAFSCGSFCGFMVVGGQGYFAPTD